MMGCARWSTCKYFGDKSAAGDVDSGFYTGCVHGVREKRCGHASVERERVQRARLDGTFAYGRADGVHVEVSGYAVSLIK